MNRGAARRDFVEMASWRDIAARASFGAIAASSLAPRLRLMASAPSRLLRFFCVGLIAPTAALHVSHCDALCCAPDQQSFTGACRRSPYFSRL